MSNRAPVFRETAIRNYMKGKEEVVLPRIISPRTALYLWVIFILLGIAIGAAWTVDYQIFEPTIALATTTQGNTTSFLVLVSADAKVQAGQTILIHLGAESVSGTITEVSSQMSPEAIRQKYRLDAGQAMMIAQPTGVAVVKIDHELDTPSIYAGGIYQADISIKSERVIALLPIIGKYLEK